MSRFNLLLADIDEWYIEGLSKFIRSSFSSKFTVNVFTRKASLLEFLNNNVKGTDILLACPEMLPDESELTNISSTIVLSDGKIEKQYKGHHCINKYQPGERIISSIIEIHSGRNPGIEAVLKGTRKTRTVSLYSPQGGSGKTVISVNLALHFARMGLKTFYLNLESLNSSSFFLEAAANETTFSNVIFHLKSGGQNLPVKIDIAKCLDSKLSIFYFKPADCSLELDELTDTDTNNLLRELCNIGQFDVIIVDTESGISKKNISVLDNSDTVLVVLLQDILTRHKLKLFNEELRKYKPDFEKEIYDKTITVINRYIPNSVINDTYLENTPIHYRIPYLMDLYMPYGEQYTFNPDNNMGIYIKGIAASIMDSSD